MVSDKGVPTGAGEKPLRYGKLPEIHHIFRVDQKMPNILISTVFTLAAIATLPVLLGAVSSTPWQREMARLTQPVALSWWQRQSFPAGLVGCSARSRFVCWIHHWNRRYPIHVLFELEFVPDFTSTLRCWHCDVLERKSSTYRSPRSKIGWFAVIEEELSHLQPADRRRNVDANAIYPSLLPILHFQCAGCSNSQRHICSPRLISLLVISSTGSTVD